VNKGLTLIYVLLLASTLSLAQVSILPLSEVRAGMKGVGRTVFAGNTIEDFTVEVLGVVENSSPGQTVILARISGGPLAETGVIQGMSGSPVYVDGRLMGAVALGFPMATAAICGIRPIEEMIAVDEAAPEADRARAVGGAGPSTDASVLARVRLGDRSVDHVLPAANEVSVGEGSLQAIRTPVTLSGFSNGTLSQFAPMAERLGLRLAQGFSGSSGLRDAGSLSGDQGLAQERPGGAGVVAPVPGSMISVQLMRGQMQVAADGTVTHVDGNRVYAFGHRFLAVGTTELPFARSEVITVLPSRNTSFKITRSGEPLGVIQQDRSAAITGELGASATMAPLRVTLSRQDGAGRSSLEREYRMEMVRDPFLAPLLLQMAVFSAVDATERSVGAATLRVDATLRFQNGVPSLRIRNLHAGGAMVGLLGALGVSVPAGYALQSGFRELTLAGAEIELTLLEQRQELRLEQMWSSTKEASPGEEIEIHASLLDDDGAERRASFRYRVPRGAPAGPLYFSAADASTLNLLDFPRFSSLTPRSPQQLLGLINGQRTNDRLYLRVWRQEPTYSIQGADLPAPPPSAALILDRSADAKGGRSALQSAALTELSTEFPAYAVSGAKTIKLEIKAN
jgi:hypothetical protein